VEGLAEGARVGTALGAFEGLTVGLEGLCVGATVSGWVAWLLDATVGSVVSSAVGSAVDSAVGSVVGSAVICAVGSCVGSCVGSAVGSSEGSRVVESTELAELVVVMLRYTGRGVIGVGMVSAREKCFKTDTATMNKTTVTVKTIHRAGWCIKLARCRPMPEKYWKIHQRTSRCCMFSTHLTFSTLERVIIHNVPYMR